MVLRMTRDTAAEHDNDNEEEDEADGYHRTSPLSLILDFSLSSPA
jgi:hypothetical protein